MLRSLWRALLGAAVILGCGGAAKQSEVSLPTPLGSAPPADSTVLVQPTGKDERGAAVPIDTKDPIWGSRHALVTIVEFSDFQCPFCGRATPTVAQLEHDYGDHALRVVFKHYPLSFHPNAKPCAEAAATVRALGGNAAFWTFHDLAFQNQTQLGSDQYVDWARQAGVNVAQFQDAMAQHRFADVVDDDMALGTRVGVQGTPAFFINGILLSGAQPVEKFKAIIDAQVTAAKEKLAAGTAPDDLYTALASANFVSPASRDDEEPADTKVWKVPLGTSPQLGPKTALVTIVEFSDYQCPYCKRVEATLQQVRTTYGSNVRIVFKNRPLPMHPRALPAAELALEARAEKGETGFWAAHDALFASQGLDDADLDRIATQLGLDLAKVHAAITTNKHKAVIDKDDEEGDDFAASGTPHFFIDGHRLVGAQPFDKFKAIIDADLAKAKTLVAAGTKPEDVYGELTKNGIGDIEQKTITFPSDPAPTKGPSTATVTIVEFADFQCPYCKKADPTLTDVLKAYPTQVKLAWRHLPLPFHQQAELTAEASVEAFKEKGNDGFWKMHDALYAHQSDVDGLSRTSIDGYASTLGLDATKFKNALDTGKHAGIVDADAKAAQAAGLSGTPAFLVGRGPAIGTWTAYLVSGAQPLHKFKKAVDLVLGSHP